MNSETKTTVQLTEDERAGLFAAVERGIDDRRDYMVNGNPHIDYGDEWPESARIQAAEWRLAGSAVRVLGAGKLADDCDQIAQSFEASATEYEGSASDDEDEDDGTCDDCEAAADDSVSSPDSAVICRGCFSAAVDFVARPDGSVICRACFNAGGRCLGGNPAVNGVCDVDGCICIGEEPQPKKTT
jgi:hypothetical protein